MTETLQEFCDSRGVSMGVDAAAGVIRGVKILGLHSRNGRTYPPEALARAARLYEQAKVNVNHPRGNPAGPRDYRDRIGAIRNVVVRPGEGLFGDLHFNPKHALAEQLAWDAEHAPQNVGFSHNVQARTTRRGDQIVVEEITSVQGVDLVADPATTRGLFESDGGVDGTIAAGKATAELSFDVLKRDHPELVEQIQAEQADELKRLRAEVARLEASEAAGRRRETIRRLLREFNLPDPDDDDPGAQSVTSRRFVEALLAAGGEREIRELIEERAALVRTLREPAGRAPLGDAKPLARDRHLLDTVFRLDTKGFVEAIT